MTIDASAAEDVFIGIHLHSVPLIICLVPKGVDGGKDNNTF